MPLKIINELKRAEPAKRAEILNRIRAKNIEFLRGFNGELADAVEQIGTGRFEIRINRTFLDIVDNEGKFHHPPGDLLGHARRLGSPYHHAWKDLIEVRPRVATNTEHGQRVFEFVNGLYKAAPDVGRRLVSKQITLPKMRDGRRYSGVTMFLGIFTGLHIENYINLNEVRDIILVEPETEYFSLSCFFLDYAAIKKRFGRILLHVGPDVPNTPLDSLVGGVFETAGAWLRMLPAYHSELFDEIINKISLRWRGITEVFVPYDREVRGLCYGAENLKAGRRILTRVPKLSENSRIAVVGSGPSLNHDLDWLRENQDRLIIICATSTGRSLQSNGIRPDFQCMLDLEFGEELFQRLGMDPTVPLVAYFKASPDLLSRFETVLLVPEAGKASPARMTISLTGTHPTTGNLATAVAVMSRPSELYFLGMDLGTRDAMQSRVRDTHYDHDDGSLLKREARHELIPVKANFEESEGEICTHAYHNASRAGIESVVKTMGVDRKVFNLADGARIVGAEPLHTADCVLDPYPEKAADVEALESVFEPASEKSWSPFERGGVEMLDRMREGLFESLELDEFRWEDFAKGLDRARHEAFRRAMEGSPNDLRVEAYHQLIHGLLVEWYKAMAFCEEPDDAERLYRTGLELLKETLSMLEWPEELESLHPAASPHDDGQESEERAVG